MNSPVTSGNAGKTPNTSFREGPSFHVLASQTPPLRLLGPPASLDARQLASLDKITCLAPVLGASPPLPQPPTSTGCSFLACPTQPCLAVDQVLT